MDRSNQFRAKLKKIKSGRPNLVMDTFIIKPIMRFSKWLLCIIIFVLNHLLLLLCISISFINKIFHVLKRNIFGEKNLMCFYQYKFLFIFEGPT